MDKPGHCSLVIDMEVGECLHVSIDPAARPDDQTATVTMLAKSGKRARLRVVAAPGIKVRRTLVEKIPALA